MLLTTKKIIKDWTDYNGHMNLSYYILLFDMGAEHYPLFYIALVGKSASGRKTNAYSHPRNIFSRMDDMFGTTFMKDNLDSC